MHLHNIAFSNASQKLSPTLQMRLLHNNLWLKNPLGIYIVSNGEINKCMRLSMLIASMTQSTPSILQLLLHAGGVWFRSAEVTKCLLKKHPSIYSSEKLLWTFPVSGLCNSYSAYKGFLYGQTRAHFRNSTNP